MKHPTLPSTSRWIPALVVALVFPWSCHFAFSQKAADIPIDFNRDVRPILSDQCFSCHGFDANQRKAKLRLDTPEGALAKTKEGAPVIQPGKPESSEVWLRINTDDESLRMPPSQGHKALKPREKEIIKTWITQGARYSKHWSFVSPKRPTLPAGYQGNPVNFFIREGFKGTNLNISREGDRAVLLRRLSLDLTGLPPTLEELDTFLKDTSPNAYEKQVDRLLASPRFGERMAGMWLDVARYGDTNGYLHDLLRTGWPWRDWVIQSFNQDKPFDQFVLEQLAGDLLPGAKPEQILATAFLRNHPITAEGGTIAAEYLNEYAADRVQTIGTGLFGLSFNCCRCHDHKFDPISMEDFYSLLAYFNSTTEKHVENNQASAYDPSIEIASPLNPGGPKAKVMVMKDGPAPKATFVLTRGQYDQPNPMKPVTRRAPKVLTTKTPEGTQDRLTLAKWIISEENPLLARVTANRIWQRFFGTGLVGTPDDFGVQGQYPTHPELLDLLAVAYREGAGNPQKPWSTKDLVRLIVTSETYRQDSAVRPEQFQADPSNRLLSHFPRQRLDAEQIRDQALFASGLLNSTLGGAPVFPYQPDGLWEERGNEGSNTRVFKRSEGDALRRRSLYTFWKRTCPPPLMSVFDAPDRLTCSVKRNSTNTPLQALATLNDEQMLECAVALGAITLEDKGPPSEKLNRLFRRIVSRAPTTKESELMEKTLKQLLKRFEANPKDAETLIRQGIYTPPAKMAKTDLAAWMLLSSALLNLDEAVMKN